MFKKSSLARTVATYFAFVGLASLAVVTLVLLFSASRLSDYSSEESLRGAADDLSQSLELASSGPVFMLSNIEQWGYDALYGNLAYRLIDENGRLLQRSGPTDEDNLLSQVPYDIPLGVSRFEQLGADVYRLEHRVVGGTVHIDVARSDRLAELALEAVLPALTESAVATISIVTCFFIFGLYVASTRISSTISRISQALVNSGGSPDLSEQGVDEVPEELVPLVVSFRNALEAVIHGHEVQRRFTANAAHELKTPLTVARLVVEKSETMDSSEKEEVIHLVDQTAAMVEGLLELAKAQQKSEYHSTMFSIRDVVSRVEKMLSPLAASKNVSINNRCMYSELQIFGDPTAWTIALKNLVENGILHPRDVSAVTLELTDKTLAVVNDGESIPVHVRPHLFERFYRGTGDGAGGLGLCVAEEIIAHHKCVIEYEDITEGGSRFSINMNSIGRISFTTDKAE